MQMSSALLTFAYIAEHFAQTGDLVIGLLERFTPVAKRAGRKIVSEQFAADVAPTNGGANAPT